MRTANVTGSTARPREALRPSDNDLRLPLVAITFKRPPQRTHRSIPIPKRVERGTQRSKERCRPERQARSVDRLGRGYDILTLSRLAVL